MRAVMVLALAVAGIASPALHAAPAALSARVDDPRAFGHSVGDVLTRRIHLSVPEGLALDPASLPVVGRRGKALELRSVILAGDELTLQYQVFLSPRETRVLEMPPISLRFTGTPREQSLRIDAWPVSVSPLVTADAPVRTGLGELRPDAPPPLIDVSGVQARLIAFGVLLALLAAYLAHVYIGLPWWARHRRPFGQAWRALRALPADASPAARRAAWVRVHDALNRTAGEVVFESGVDRLIATQPQFATLRGELMQFFERSRREFFAASAVPSTANADDPAWLVAFCRRCRDAERGAA